MGKASQKRSLLDLLTNKIFTGRDKLHFRSKKCEQEAETWKTTAIPGQRTHRKAPTLHPTEADHLPHFLCSETQPVLQKACIGNSVHNGACYDSPTLLLKRDRDGNRKGYFNPSIDGEEQNRY